MLIVLFVHKDLYAICFPILNIFYYNEYDLGNKIDVFGLLLNYRDLLLHSPIVLIVNFVRLHYLFIVFLIFYVHVNVEHSYVNFHISVLIHIVC